MKQPRIVVLGGGTGSFTLLQGLKKLTPHLTAIVNMSDDGGSTGTLRDELGVLPPGDIRQCLVALSDSLAIRNLFSYRFESGRLAGQSMGNLILSSLELQHGNFQTAVDTAADILHITGSVVPVTLTKHTLVVRDGDQTYRTEHLVDGALPLSKQAQVELDPVASLNPRAKQALLAADLVVIAPGSVFTSLLPIMAVDGLRAALGESPAKVVMVANLINKPLQTDDWHIVDYVQQIEHYIGADRIDAVLYNNEPITKRLLSMYAADGEYPVQTSQDRFSEIAAQAIGARLVAKEVSAQQTGDELHRTLIRHDSDQVYAELAQVLL